MEIAPVPHRATRGERRRLALGVLVLAPVIMLVLLPSVLGLDRYVVTENGMDGALGRGSVVLAREVPPTDLRVGDVITLPRPGGNDDERVVRRIASVKDGVATTAADRTGVPDPWTVPLTDSSYARVTAAVPWIGYPFVVDGGWVLLLMAAATALALALTIGRRPPAPVAGQPRTPQPVG